jgi:Glycosyltransferase family 87
MISAKLLQIEDRVFTEHRVRLYAIGVVIAYGLSLAWLVLKRGWVTLPNGDIRGIDFGWMWLSGRLAASGEATKVFDHAAFSAAQLTFYFPHLTSGSGYLFNRFYYPPTFLFFTYPLGLMSYVTACAVWIVFSLVLYEAALYTIMSRRVMLIAAATPFFVIENIDFTHTGFVTAGLMGLSLVFVNPRPLASGIFLGLLAYKPHFGLLFPLALCASRNWRAFGSAAAATVGLGVIAAIAFGRGDGCRSSMP